jgi:hypothetical protein
MMRRKMVRARMRLRGRWRGGKRVGEGRLCMWGGGNRPFSLACARSDSDPARNTRGAAPVAPPPTHPPTLPFAAGDAGDGVLTSQEWRGGCGEEGGHARCCKRPGADPESRTRTWPGAAWGGGERLVRCARSPSLPFPPTPHPLSPILPLCTRARVGGWGGGYMDGDDNKLVVGGGVRCSGRGEAGKIGIGRDRVDAQVVGTGSG